MTRLISSLASYARVNSYGFIETPYKTIRGNEEVKYYSASEEHHEHVIAQAGKGHAFDDDEYIAARRRGESEIVRGEEADLIDVATSQLVSVAASLIPFLALSGR